MCPYLCTSEEKMVERADYLMVSCPRCHGSMCLRCSVAIPSTFPTGKHRCSLLREEGADYEICSDCYGGRYRYGHTISGMSNTNQFVFIMGTWNAWTAMHEMEKEGSDTHVYTVQLGDMLEEQFHFVLDRDEAQAIFPAKKRAAETARASGPGINQERMHWLIDGRRDGSSVGAIYRVTFRWTTVMEVTWQPVPSHLPLSLGDGVAAYRHTYYLVSSAAAWNPLPMAACAGEPGLHKAGFRIGASGAEEFHIVRDHDQEQVIHPAGERATGPEVPLRGPDGAGAGKNWLVSGRARDEVRVSLRVTEGRLELRLQAPGVGTRTWSGEVRGCAYYLSGSFNDYEFQAMEPRTGSVSVYRSVITVGRDDAEEFQIVADKDWAQTLYPAVNGAGSGQSVLKGPGLEEDGASWRICGQEGQSFEVVLDLDQPDHRKAVCWRDTSEPKEALEEDPGAIDPEDPEAVDPYALDQYSFEPER